MIDPSSPITTLGPFAKRLEKPLKNLGIKTIGELIFYFPYRYDDLSKLIPIRDIEPGAIVTVKGKIQFIRNFRSPVKHKLITEALVRDLTGGVRAIWFNQVYLPKILRAGEDVFLSGRLDSDRAGFYFINPNYELARETQIHTGRIVPVYSLTSSISEKQIRALVHSSLRQAAEIQDWLPEEILRAHKLMPLDEALINIHFPGSQNALRLAEYRFKFNKLFLLQLINASLKSELGKACAWPIKFFEAETKNFVESLPFKLTGAQRQTAWEILKDLGRDKPMNRLFNGDVGSGKTVVAAIAFLNSTLSGGQSAMLAPTEILALQHFNTLLKLLAPHSVRVALLTSNYFKISGQSEEIKKTFVKTKIKKGEVDLVIGTHALLEADVEFKNLVLAVVDEQHRFGVHQRQILRSQHNSDLKKANAPESKCRDGDPSSKARRELREGKTNNFESFECNLSYSRRIPHFLSMTATPIPRTLALTIYGDLDLSILDEMPPGRKLIKTKFVGEERQKVYDLVKKEINKGRQIFCICPLIDPSDALGVKSVKEMKEHLEKQIFPHARIALLHGKMKAGEKEKVMRDFLDRKFDILVSTSVVEVGVDVPNATVMMIEGAERFGLSQLHQFRGRVGRSEYESYCFLFSDAAGGKAVSRLRILEQNHDGFVLAEHDLKLRGAGDLYGAKQWGFEDDRMLDFSDLELIKISREAANNLIEKDGTLNSLPALKEKVEKFMEEVHPE